MRTLTSTAATQAAQALGTEPLLVLKIMWPTGQQFYADKDIPLISAFGRIVQAGEINAQKKQDNVGTVSAVSFTLDDFDGTLKTLIDSYQAEGTVCSVYQYFEGTTLADMVLLYKGWIVSPIEWSEGDRTLKFEVETKSRDTEVGFSADLGSLPSLNPDAVDQAWPLAFGNVVHVPALKLITAPKTTLTSTFINPQSSFTVADGSLFVGGNIEVIIDGIVFSGSMVTDPTTGIGTFHVGEANLPKYINLAFTDRVVGDIDYNNRVVGWLAEPAPVIINNYIYITDEFKSSNWFRVVKQIGNKIWVNPTLARSDRPSMNPDGTPVGSTRGAVTGIFGDGVISFGIGETTYLFGPGRFINEVAQIPRIGWKVTLATSVSSFLQVVEAIDSTAWKIQAGAEVSEWSPSRKDVFVANLLPSSAVVSVYAQRNYKGSTGFVSIPSSYYQVSTGDTALRAQINAGTNSQQLPYNPTTITFQTPLSEFTNQGWGDQIWVTLRSTVGPNTSDIIAWLLTNYSTLGYDAGSFATVAAQIANYPSSFAVFSKESVISFVENIAWQARCAVILDNGTMFLKYLSLQPSADLTLNESQIENHSISLTFTPYEDIVTRFRAKYKTTYRGDKKSSKEIYIKENIAVFGLHHKDYDFYIYNIPALVQKSATFWAHRYANSWRLVRLSTPLATLALQIYDCLQLSLSDTTILNTASIKSIVDKHNYKVQESMIGIEAWLPSIAGSTSVDPKAWLTDGSDTLPADPTLRWGATTYDFTEPDAQSKVFGQAISSNTSPGIVNDTSTASPGQTDGDPDKPPLPPTTTATTTEYKNGYGNPPSGTVTGVVLDPSLQVSPGDKVTIYQSGATHYIIPSSSAAAVFPAKIKSVDTPSAGKYVIDEYEDGYAKPKTKGDLAAIPVDDTIAFTVDQKVTVFLDKGELWIIGSPAGTQFIAAEITGGTGVWPSVPYTWKQINLDIGGPPYTYIGAGMTNGYEMNGSTIIQPGTRVWMNKVHDTAHSRDNYWFFFPLATC